MADKPDRAWARRVKRQFQKAMHALQDIHERIESGRMARATLTPEQFAELSALLNPLNPLAREAEFDKRSKAIRAGMQRAKNERGKRFGGARNPRQYDRKRIRRLARHYSQTAIAKKLGCSQSTVSKILKRQPRRK